MSAIDYGNVQHDQLVTIMKAVLSGDNAKIL